MSNKGPSEVQLVLQDVMNLNGMKRYLIVNEDGASLPSCWLAGLLDFRPTDEAGLLFACCFVMAFASARWHCFEPESRRSGLSAKPL
jgi:hypothetical protein